MKISNQVQLALCVLHPVAAFFVQGPRSAETMTLRSSAYFRDGMPLDTAGNGRPSPDRFSAGPLSNARIPSSKNIWREESTTLIQGNTLRTWPLTTSMIDMVEISMATEGRPLNANVEL